MAGSGLLTAHVRRHWGGYAAGVGMVVCSSLLSAQIPRLLGMATDALKAGNAGVPELGGFAAAIVSIGCVRVFSGWAGRLLVHYKGRKLTWSLRRALFLKWCRLSPAYYHRQSTGELIAHALSDVEIVGDLMTLGLNQSVSGLALLAGTMFLMVEHTGWKLTLAALGPLLCIPVLVYWLGPAIRRQSMRAQEALGVMSNYLEESVVGIRAIRAFGRERLFTERFVKKVDAIVGEKIGFARLSSLFAALVPLMFNLGFIAILGYGGFLVSEKTISVGDFVALTLYVALLRMPLEQLGNVVNIVLRALPSLQRVDHLLQVDAGVPERQAGLADARPSGDVAVRGLTFSYPGSDRQALAEITFTVRPGKTLGVIGAVGSGKSTLADLLLRLYEPPAGTIRIGGRDILSYPLQRLREGIGYVPQDGFLFSGSVLENIGFSDEQPDPERARQCAHVAAIHESILEFPEGYATQLGDRGVRLSGGQKQRIAIARMIYKQVPIMILDDALSAVDAATERRILANLRDWQSGDTVTIIISHRLGAVMHADEILVLDRGRVVERGTHAALLARDGAYARQWHMQSGCFGTSSPHAREYRGRAGGDAAAEDFMGDAFPGDFAGEAL